MNSNNKKEKKELLLKDKVEVLKYLDGKNSERDTALKFQVSKGTISNIKKNRESIIELSKQAPETRIRKVIKTENEDYNNLVWIWFEKAQNLYIPITGPIIQEVALKFAKQLEKENFKASNGWLDNFKNRYTIVQKVLNGESASADINNAEEFKSNFQQISEGYDIQNIFNADETALLYKALPKRSLVQKNHETNAYKTSKERLTVLFCSSALGEKLIPLVIGKHNSPRCFKNVKRNELPVIYKSSKKAWMTQIIFEEWLKQINQNFNLEKRKILLIVDNATCHQNIELSNIKLHFLPSNTTSLIQPLDQGVINSFKLYYRKRLVSSFLSQMDNLLEENKNKMIDEKQSKFKEPTVLETLYWIKQSWQQVDSQSISKCFLKAGFKIDETTLNDQSINQDSQNQLQQFIENASQQDLLDKNIKLNEYLTFDNEIQTHNEDSSDANNLLIENILEEFQITNNKIIEEQDVQDLNQISEPEQINQEVEIQCPTFSSVEKYLEEIKQFALTKYPILLEEIIIIQNKINEIKIEKQLNKIQSTLDRFMIQNN